MNQNFEIKLKMHDFYLAEGQWVDEIVRNQYPKWVIWLAEKGFKSSLLKIIIAKFSGLEIKRAQNTGLLDVTPGFRAGKAGYKINSITTSVLKKGRVIDKKEFRMSLHIPADFNPNILK